MAAQTIDACPPARALAASHYTDPATFARARDRLFLRSWQYVGHASQLPEAGDYLAFALLDQDLVVIRDRDGELRGFYNVCQHRAHPLVEGRGRARLLVCPYDAWTYELNPGIEGRVLTHEHSARERCSWLVAIENYNECYHCRHVDQAFASGVVDPASYDIRPVGPGRVLHHRAGAASGIRRWYDATDPAYGSFFLFPAFSLQIYPGGLVATYHWRPLAPDDTEVHRGWLSPDGVVDDQLQRGIDLDRETTFAEDLGLVEAVQPGLGSRGYRPGPLVIAPEAGIDSEHAIAALDRWVLDDLA